VYGPRFFELEINDISDTCLCSGFGRAQVVPNICRRSKGAEVPTPFAFVSVEDTSKPANEAKALRGQIRVYDLTKGRQVSNLLAEVSFSGLSPSLINFWPICITNYLIW
jgi:hypothetical protein